MCSSPRFPSWHPYSNTGWVSSLVSGMVNVQGLVHVSGSSIVTCHCNRVGDTGVKRSTSLYFSLAASALQCGEDRAISAECQAALRMLEGFHDGAWIDPCEP